MTATSVAYQTAVKIATLTGIGDLGGTSGWPVFVDSMPTVPDNCIGVFTTGTSTFGNINPVTKYYQISAIQIRLRGNVADHSEIHALWEVIKTGLIGSLADTFSGYTYLARLLETDLVKLFTDENQRDVWMGEIAVHRRKD